MDKISRTKQEEYAVLLAASIYRQLNSVSADDAYAVVREWSQMRVESYIRDNRKVGRK